MQNPTIASEKQFLNFKNLIENPGFENGSTAGWSKTAGTLSVVSVSNGVGAGKFSGNFVHSGAASLYSSQFTLPEYYAGILKVSCRVATSASIYTMVLRDVTNSVDIYSQVINPTPAYGLGYQFVDQNMEIQFPAGLKVYQLRIVGSAIGSMLIDNVKVGIKEDPTTWINAISDSVSYTPAFQGFGTATAIDCKYSQSGQYLIGEVKFLSGTVTAVEARVGLPTGLLSASDYTALQVVGETWTQTTNGAGGYVNDTLVLVEPGKNYVVFNAPASTTLSKVNANTIFSNTAFQTMRFAVRIQGWTSGFSTPDQVGVNLSESYSGRKSANQNIPNITNTKITWPTVVDDLLGSFDTTNNRFVAKTSGRFVATIQVQWAQNSSSYRSLVLYKNGVTTNYASQITGASSGGFDLIHSLNPPPIFLNAGDYLEVFAYQPAGAGINIVNGDYTFFGVKKLDSPNAFMNIRKIATLKDVKAANTAGGGYTLGSFVTRDLNTKVDPNGIVSLTSNQFVLQAGTYRISANVPMYSAGSFVSKLRNITDSTDTAVGTPEIVNVSADRDSARSLINEVFTITSAKTFEIQSRGTATQGTNGLGFPANLGVSEVYTVVEIEKIL